VARPAISTLPTTCLRGHESSSGGGGGGIVTRPTDLVTAVTPSVRPRGCIVRPGALRLPHGAIHGLPRPSHPRRPARSSTCCHSCRRRRPRSFDSPTCRADWQRFLSTLPLSDLPTMRFGFGVSQKPPPDERTVPMVDTICRRFHCSAMTSQRAFV